MKSIKEILVEEFSQLTEDYDSRIQQIVDQIIKSYPNGITQDQVLAVVKSIGSRINAPEVRMGSGTFKEFVSDVTKKLQVTGLLKRAASKRTSTGPSQETLQKIANAIQRFAGDSFPDGDPIDQLGPWMRRQGLEPNEDLLSKAAKLLGAKSYNDYLASMYDDFTGDNPGVYNLDPKRNPWRESVEEGAENPNKVALQYDNNAFDAQEINDAIKQIETTEKQTGWSDIGFNSEDGTIFFWDEVPDSAFDELSAALDWFGIPNRKIDNTIDESSYESYDEYMKRTGSYKQGIQLPLEDPSKPWDTETNRRVITLVKKPNGTLVGKTSDDSDMLSAILGVGFMHGDTVSRNEERHANNKGYTYKVEDMSEDRDYFVNETLRRIQTLAGINK